MRKMIVTLAVLLLATSAMADVRIIIDTDGTLRYDTDGEHVRAFALDITADGGTIENVTGYIKGESVAPDNVGYGIFMASFGQYITVDADGTVASWDVPEYTPLADPCDPGALPGLGTAGVTLEFGTLYYPTDDSSPNAPGTSGVLCVLETSGTSLSAEVNEARGGVVLTDPTVPAVVNTDQATDVEQGDGEPFSSAHPDYNEWVAMSKPACWTYLRQCLGDADGKLQGNPKQGYWAVGTNDLNVLIAAWLVKEPPQGPGIATVSSGGVAGICADFKRDQQGNPKQGYWRVGTNDLNVLIGNWLIKEPTQGPGLTMPPEGCGGTVEP